MIVPPKTWKSEMSSGHSSQVSNSSIGSGEISIGACFSFHFSNRLLQILGSTSFKHFVVWLFSNNCSWFKLYMEINETTFQFYSQTRESNLCKLIIFSLSAFCAAAGFSLTSPTSRLCRLDLQVTLISGTEGPGLRHSRKKVGSWDPGSKSVFGPN